MCESRWPSRAVRPNEPSGFRGRKAILNHASALVSACPVRVCVCMGACARTLARVCPSPCFRAHVCLHAFKHRLCTRFTLRNDAERCTRSQEGSADLIHPPDFLNTHTHTHTHTHSHGQPHTTDHLPTNDHFRIAGLTPPAQLWSVRKVKVNMALNVHRNHKAY